ncbi:MAG TPA: SctK family type III secretion system sorting platform protein [Usitatibacter sp.]|nr:SctK family type III secretion system sorting platform protein [Usitatibacter sp.]
MAPPSSPEGDLATRLAVLLGKERALYLRLHEFNLLPSRNLDTSWHGELFPAAMQPLLARSDALDARAHRWLSAYLLQTPRLAGEGFWSPSTALSLALLAPPALMDLARRIGVALASGTLRSLLAGRGAAQARHSLGESLHEFALQRAPLLITRAELEAAAGLGGKVEAADLAPGVERVGIAALRAAWEAEGLWPRASLKLPRALATAAEAAPILQAATASRVAQRIAREGILEWHTSSAPAAA